MENKKNILVVDDDSVAHLLSEKVIASFEWINKVHKAFNGKEAIGLMENYCKGLFTIPDLILLDLHMPVMDGFEFIEAFQNMDCLKDNRVVIAVLSSSENPKELERIHSMGIRHIIKKPISLEKFRLLWRNEFQNSCL